MKQLVAVEWRLAADGFQQVYDLSAEGMKSRARAGKIGCQRYLRRVWKSSEQWLPFWGGSQCSQQRSEGGLHPRSLEVEPLQIIGCQRCREVRDRGEEGFNYCKKYFGGGKRVDSNVTCIVEFECEEKMVADLFSRFSKAEDGCMSTGLGHKAGKTLSIFNDCLKRGETTFRIVFVRRLKKGK